MFGKANDLSPQYIDILTEHYDLIQLSYRLLPEVSLDCIIDDIFTSFDAIQSQYSNCPIFTFGRSSGAYLSLLIARDRDIDGVIDFMVIVASTLNRLKWQIAITLKQLKV